MPVQKSLFERLVAKFVVSDGCWEWSAYRDPNGYGRIGRGGRADGVVLAHRAAYELFVGPVPDGLEVLHRCDNPPCVRPDHLEVGTHHQNMLDAATRGRMASGDRNGSKTHPERIARGATHYTRRFQTAQIGPPPTAGPPA